MFSRVNLKKALMFGSGALGLLSLSKILEVNKHLHSLKDKLKRSDDVYTLSGRDYSSFPWEPRIQSLSSYQDWEMKKVRVRGLMSSSYFLVGRERRGVKGYLVFGGLTTGLIDQ